MRQALIISVALCIFSLPAYGQSIEVGQLGSAAAFDVGVIDEQSGGLDKNLWQGTSASRATYLLNSLETEGISGLPRELVRAVVLSGGTPPRSDSGNMETGFKKARLQSIIDLGEMAAAQSIINRTPLLSADNVLKSDMALLAGDTQTACGVADIVSEGRAEPQWARLRAFCHVLRGEVPAAELTADILKTSGYEDPAFYSLLQIISGGSGKPDLENLKADDPLHMALMSKAALPWDKGGLSQSYAARLALNSISSADDRMKALFQAGAALSDAQISEILTSFLAQTETEEGETADIVLLDEAISKNDAIHTARLYEIARSGQQVDRPKAIAELLSRADAVSMFDRFAEFLAPLIQTLSPEEQSLTNLKLFTRAAIVRGDVTTLRQFHGLLENDPSKQARMALVSDALGYGFLGGGLGTDIESRFLVDETQDRASRDAFIASALGASLSLSDMATLEELSSSSGRAVTPGQRLALDAAARAGSRAETALQAAKTLTGERLNTEGLYTVIQALNEAGLTRWAGRLAAEDFLVDL